MHTPDQIKAAIKDLPELTIDQLVHNWKCAHSKADKLYKPFLDAIERELRKRRKTDDELPTEPDLPQPWRPLLRSYWCPLYIYRA